MFTRFFWPHAFINSHGSKGKAEEKSQKEYLANRTSWFYLAVNWNLSVSTKSRKWGGKKWKRYPIFRRLTLILYIFGQQNAQGFQRQQKLHTIGKPTTNIREEVEFWVTAYLGVIMGGMFTSLRTVTHQNNFECRLAEVIQQLNISTGISGDIYIYYMPTAGKTPAPRKRQTTLNAETRKTSHGNVPLCPCAYAVTQWRSPDSP